MNKTSIYPVFIALIVALGGFLLGFDGVVNGGAVAFYRVTFGISDIPILIGFSSSAIILGGIFGNLSVGFLMDRIGRKPSLMITAILFMIGAGGTALSQNIIPFIISKFIAGLGVGIAILVAPTYIAEIAPPKQRGWLVSFNQLNIVLGLSVAMLSNYFILKNIPDPDLNWRWMLGVGFFPAALYFGLLFLVPESPRWLMQKGRNEEARAILVKAGGMENAEQEYKSIKQSLDRSASAGKVRLSSLFTREMRFVLFIGFLLAFFQQASGINAVLYYAPMIFESAGNKMDAAFLMAIVLGVVFTVATILSMFLIDRLGRRPLLIIGSIVMAASLMTVSLTFKKASYTVNSGGIEQVVSQIGSSELDSESASFTDAVVKSLEQMNGVIFQNEIDFFKAALDGILVSYEDADHKEIGKRLSESCKQPLLKASISINGLMVLLGILGFIAGFSISLGPVMWTLFSEIFPNRLRAKAISVVGAANALTSFSVATLFPIELATIGSSTTYFIYSIMMVLCLFFVIKYIPETKGKSLEELEAKFVRK